MKIKHQIIIIAILLFSLFSFFSVSAGERRSVSASIANIRSGPGTHYKTLWKVEKYQPLNIIQTSDKWLKFIDFEGDKGWIYKPLTSNTPTVIVKKENCNIRSGPGTNHKIVFKAGKGVPFKVLEKKDSWLHIQHADGDKGWIYNSLVW